ncbi:MAG TPA: hypothetical protein VF577_08145 [Allosphingosinicella sp.]|jgi:hypothetical protein
MSRTASKATVTVSGNTIHFAQAGVYTIEHLPSGHVQIKLDGGKATVVKAADWAAINGYSFGPGAILASPVVVDGVTFTEAGPGGPFEVSPNLDAVIGNLFTRGVDYVLANLTVNGSRADSIKAVWDYLDDFYVAGVQYNEAFVRLGVAYVAYLDDGGEPFTFVTAKFIADGSDSDLTPERNQSMHDNLLGNLTAGAINGRFAANPALRDELLALVPNEYETRQLYEGTDGQAGGPRHDNVRAFDYDHGWDRPDFVDRDYSGLIDPLARNGGEMHYGDGNPVDDWNIVRHEGAQVELGLKVKHRGGDEYAEYSIGPDGVAVYQVAAGGSPSNAARAEWNFDFAATDFSADDDFTYLVELDVDPTAGVLWSTVYSSARPFDSDVGTGSTFQNSSNVAFYASPNPLLERPGIDMDPGTAGVQPYGLGDATFNIRLSAFDADSGLLVARNEVQVIVGDGIPFG